MTWRLAPVAARKPIVASSGSNRRAVTKVWAGAVRAVWALALMVLLGGAPRACAEAATSADGWVEFAANWTASGRQHTLATARRAASIFELSGPFVVTRGDGLSRGFFADAIGFVERDAL